MGKYQTIHTERLILRVVSPEVHDAVFQLAPNEVCTFFGFSTLSEMDVEKQRYEKGFSTFNKTFLYFQLIEKESMSVIGWCGYHTWYLDHQRAELGYGLNTDYFKRRGLMTEALSEVLKYGFSDMKLHRIEAFASPKNTPSVKLLINSGFEKEGLLKEHYLKDGVYEDSTVYALINKA